MTNFYEAAHQLAHQLNIQISDPPEVTEADQRREAFAELRQRPAPAPLAQQLAAAPTKEWNKLIKAHSVERAERDAVMAVNTNAFVRAFERAVAAAADDYLAILAPAVQLALDKATTSATHVTTTDTAESISRGEGLALHDVQHGVAALAAYAALLAGVVPKVRGTRGTDLPVWAELAVIDPGHVPTEIRDRHTITQATVNPPDERRHIDAARRLLRSPRTQIAEQITTILIEDSDPFALIVPTTIADAQTILARWTRANHVEWAN